jgi:hypothetical protein
MSVITDRVDRLDTDLLGAVPNPWDRLALLALHSAIAHSLAPFSYLEIGSYLGDSLHALVRDPRCNRVMSIDARTRVTPDNRSTKPVYEQNTTARMLSLLAALPDSDLSKVLSFESGTDTLSIYDLPARPDYCFIDGEHTDAAALNDARFCAEALGGRGVIAFHDYMIVAPAIRAFLRETWREVSFVVAFAGDVFALELGGGGVLQAQVVQRALGSSWHRAAWALASRSRRSALPAIALVSSLRRVDQAIFEGRRRVRAVSRSLPWTRARRPRGGAGRWRVS